MGRRGRWAEAADEGAPAAPDAMPLLLAGAGGVVEAEGRATHEGRRCLLLTRDEDTTEMEALLDTLGIVVVERIMQRGSADPRRYMGRGRLQDTADELRTRLAGHPWEGVDLVVLHTNARPTQLVAVTDAVAVEVWDRVRLLLALFTSHAASVEARTQVRLARLQADRPLLRELARQITTGERAGFGAGGRQLVDDRLREISRETTRLQRALSARHARTRQRAEQRRRGGVRTVGLAGYTNAGKSSLFGVLSGKPVLIDDRLFSTLETTTGRMSESPRVLITDTIGFLDHLPSDLLGAFRATLAESLGSDLIIVVVDATEPASEVARKLATSRRELFERLPRDERPNLLVALSKADLASAEQLKAAQAIIEDAGLPRAVTCSSLSGPGLDELRAAIDSRLSDHPRFLLLPLDEAGEPDGRLRARVHALGRVTDEHRDGDRWSMLVWAPAAEVNRLVSRHPERMEWHPAPPPAADEER